MVVFVGRSWEGQKGGMRRFNIILINDLLTTPNEYFEVVMIGFFLKW